MVQLWLWRTERQMTDWFWRTAWLSLFVVAKRSLVCWTNDMK
jgi:hypothetical protein